MSKLPPEIEAFKAAWAAGDNGTPEQKRLWIIQRAFVAMAKGEAGAGQQKMVLTHIFNLSGLPAFDDPDAPDSKSAFTRGKRHVGMLIAYLSRTPIVGASTGDETPHE